MKRALRFAQYALTLIGVLALGYCVWALLNTKYFEAREAQNFARELAVKTSLPRPAPTVSPAEEGTVLGRLDIPRLDLSVMVVEGVRAEDLRRAAGHIPGTALPGTPGNIAIAAHRDSFFRPLRKIKPNDAITLETFSGTYQYRVVSTEIVSADDVHVLDAGTQNILTLVTCFPFYYIGASPKRFVVHAERVDTTAHAGLTGRQPQ